MSVGVFCIVAEPILRLAMLLLGRLPVANKRELILFLCHLYVRHYINGLIYIELHYFLTAPVPVEVLLKRYVVAGMTGFME